MELVSFGDHLKRYIYERAELEEPFSEVPQEVYKEIVVDSFKETYTPKIHESYLYQVVGTGE